MTWQNSCGQDNNGHPIMRMLSLYVLISCVISATDLLDAAYEEQNKQETLLKKEYVTIVILNTKRLEGAINTERRINTL
jgi:hypothetical protein